MTNSSWTGIAVQILSKVDLPSSPNVGIGLPVAEARFTIQPNMAYLKSRSEKSAKIRRNVCQV